jgi:hypothetical protein
LNSTSQQIRIVDDAVAVQVGVGVAPAEGEQHLQQVGVVDHIVAVHIAQRLEA